MQNNMQMKNIIQKINGILFIIKKYYKIYLIEYFFKFVKNFLFYVTSICSFE